MLTLKSKHFLRMYLLLTAVLILGIMLTRFIIGSHVAVEQRQSLDVKINLTCKNVLKSMLTGTWIKNRYNDDEMEKLQHFLHVSRMQHFLPYNLQRYDNLCGNVTFDELGNRMNDLLWFRALCDPEGDYPCCYNNQCMSRSEKECMCKECYDQRQSIHAEFATWIPSDPGCQMSYFKDEKDTCQLLHNMTIYIVGDSFMRHVYVSLLALLRTGKYYGPLKHYTPPGLIEGCDRNFVHLRMCMSSLDLDTHECNRNVKLKFLEHPRLEHTNWTLKAVSELSGKPNSLLFIGVGIHDDFNSTRVITELLNPLLTHLSKSPWPRVLWSAAHAPGLLKTPRVPSQSRESILRYNARLRSYLETWQIPILDSFKLTDGTVSFDGAHYGRGINDVKAQILLNYLLELRMNHKIPWTFLDNKV